MNKEDQRNYELTFILSPELDEKEINSFEQEAEKDIKGLGGTLKKKSKPERRNLSYPIKKFQSGYYLVVNILLNPEKLEELSAIFKHKKEVLRYILTIAEESKAVKSKRKGLRPKDRSRLVSDVRPRTERIEKLKKLTEEITEEEIEVLKRTGKKSQPKAGPPQAEKKGVKLEEIDKKLDEILGM